MCNGQRPRGSCEAPGLAELVAGTAALDRLGGPDDIADVVALLPSDAARWSTGQVIDASGGLFLGPRDPSTVPQLGQVVAELGTRGVHGGKRR